MQYCNRHSKLQPKERSESEVWQWYTEVTQPGHYYMKMFGRRQINRALFRKLMYLAKGSRWKRFKARMVFARLWLSYLRERLILEIRYV